jgi:hypothetical protein
MASARQGRGKGIWKDERRSPGYLPQGRRRPLAIVALGVVYLLARLLTKDVLNRTELSIFVILIGLSAFWVAARMNEQRLEEERYMRGPGWMIGWLISKTSVPVARAIHIAMGIGICALGILTLPF